MIEGMVAVAFGIAAIVFNGTLARLSVNYQDKRFKIKLSHAVFIFARIGFVVVGIFFVVTGILQATGVLKFNQ